MKSELPPGLIIPIARGFVLANITKSKILAAYCELILQAQISKDRKGRLELMEALVAGRRHQDDDDI